MASNLDFMGSVLNGIFMLSMDYHYYFNFEAVLHKEELTLLEDPLFGSHKAVVVNWSGVRLCVCIQLIIH